MTTVCVFETTLATMIVTVAAIVAAIVAVAASTTKILWQWRNQTQLYFVHSFINHLAGYKIKVLLATVISTTQYTICIKYNIVIITTQIRRGIVVNVISFFQFLVSRFWFYELCIDVILRARTSRILEYVQTWNVKINLDLN